MPAALLTVLLVGLQATAPKPITPSDIAKDQKKFDQKTVSVVGKIEKYTEKVAKTSKKPYTLILVTDGKNKVNVYLTDKPKDKLKAGDKVRVTGVYRKEKKVGKLTFKNEIDASNFKVKSNGVTKVK